MPIERVGRSVLPGPVSPKHMGALPAHHLGLRTVTVGAGEEKMPDYERACKDWLRFLRESTGVTTDAEWDQAIQACQEADKKNAGA